MRSYAQDVNDIVLWVIDMVQSVDPVLRTVLAGFAIMLETSVLIGLIVPGDTVVLVASIGVESLPQAIALGITVVVGALAGESIGFWLGHWVGPRIRHSWLGRRIGAAQWVRAELYLRRRGGIAIFLSRFLPVLHSLVPLTVGMTGFGYRKFLAWTTPACVLWAIVYVSAGSALAGSYRELADTVHYAGYIFVGVVVVFLLLVYLAKRVISSRESRHMVPADDPSVEA